MKKSMTALAGVIVVCVATTGFSGPQCCPAKKKAAADGRDDIKTASAKESCSMECLVSADLSEEQLEKIKAFKAECDAAGGCSYESANKMKAKLASVLSPEQMEKMMASCSEKGCVMPQAKVEDATTDTGDVDIGPAS